MIKKLLAFLIQICLLCFILISCGQDISEKSEEFNNTITMLDVGQAACTLIESDGQFCLVDVGKSGGSMDVVSYLNSRNVKKVDLLVITHFHTDHTSEALDVIRNFDIGTVVVPSLTPENIPDTYFYKSLLADAENGYYTLAYAAQGREYTVGSGTLRVLADTYNSENINNTSTPVSYTYNDFVYVNTGDSESDREGQILEYLPENVDFFTAGHHGSQDANSTQLLSKLKPAFVGISCGKDNDYGHPHDKMLARLENMGIEHATTAETGNIMRYMDKQENIEE